MRSASRESYQAVKAALDTSTSTVEVGEELLAFAGLLAREPRLRRALSEPARGGEERADLARQLLSGKTSDEAMRLITALVGGRWSRPSELLDAAEQLGVDVLLASAESAGDLTEVEDELFRFGQIVSGDVRLAAILGDSTMADERRIALVRQLLEGKANPVTVKLAEQAVKGFGGRSFGGSLIRLVELAAERRLAEIAYVTAAEPLSEADEERLVTSLSARYGRQVSLKITLDPAVLGGLSVRVGADLYDGTVARRLATVRNALVAK